eukprot:815041-Heterocapsa_arctica.AAC.1
MIGSAIVIGSYNMQQMVFLPKRYSIFLCHHEAAPESGSMCGNCSEYAQGEATARWLGNRSESCRSARWPGNCPE